MPADLLEALRGPSPALFLPAHPAWQELFDRALQVLDPEDLPEPGQDYAGIRALRAGSGGERARQAVAGFLDRLAAGTTLPPGDALAAVLLMLEEVLGLNWLPGEGRLVWTLREAPPAGIRDLSLGDNLVSLRVEKDSGGGPVAVVEVVQPLDLQIDTEFTSFSEHIPAGTTRLLLSHLDRTDVRAD